jgi:hypothetical protein
MSTAKCRDCGQIVGTSAKTCPHCGATKPARRRLGVPTALGLIILLLAAIGIGMHEPASAPAAATATKTTPASVSVAPARAPEAPKPVQDDWERLNASKSSKDQAIIASIDALDGVKKCIAWGAEERRPGSRSPRGEALLAYLEHSNLINSKDRGNVATRQVELGMTTCGVFASLGLPNAYNQSQGSYGEHVQFVYEARRVYVYTDSRVINGWGMVTSIQRH